MLLTKAEAADQLGISCRTLEREIAAGRLPVIEIRGACRIDEQDIRSYIDRQRKTKTPPCPSENVGTIGMSAFKSAANESKEALDRLLQKRTPWNTKAA